MTPDRLVEFIPSTLANLLPLAPPTPCTSASALCEWLVHLSKQRGNSAVGASTSNPSRNPLWPRPPHINTTAYDLALAPQLEYLHTPQQLSVRACNYAATAASGETIPSLDRCKRVSGHVIASSGEVAFSRTDFVLPGPFQFRWQRYFREFGDGDSSLGIGWRHTLSEKLQLADEKSEEKRKVVLHTAEGRYIVFDLPAIGQACFNRSERMLLTRQSLHSFAVSAFSQPERVFRADGASGFAPLSELRDTCGNTLTVDYRDGLPQKIVTSWGRVLEFLYQDNRLTSIRNVQAPENATGLCLYEFDDAGRLFRACSADRREAYAYANNILCSLTSADLGHIGFTHDKFGRCQQIDHNKLVTRLRWRQRQRICVISSEDQHDTHVHFDIFGDVVSERQHDRETRFFYDHYRNLCLKTAADGQQEIFRYDQFGRLSRHSFRGKHSRYTYNASGSLVRAQIGTDSTWKFHYDGNCKPSVIIDPLERHWCCDYDERGQLRQLTDPEQGKVILEWDAQSQLRSLSIGEQYWQWQYDYAGRVTFASDGSMTEHRYAYDEVGALSTYSQGEDSLHLARDSEHRPCRIESGDGCLLQWSADEQGRIRQVGFASGEVWDLQYTARGNLAQLRTVDQAREERMYQWHYDRFGQLARFSNCADLCREWQYTRCGRISEYRNSDDHWYLDYSELGDLHKIRNNNGEWCEFHFDKNTRLTLAANAHSSLRFHYDLLGKLVAEHHDFPHDNSFSINHLYDKRGWLKNSSSESLQTGFIFAPDGTLYEMSANGGMALRTERAHTEEIWNLGSNEIRRPHQHGALVGIELADDLRWQIETSPTIGQLPGFASPGCASDEIAWDTCGNVIAATRHHGTAGKVRYHYQYDGWGLLQSTECGEFKTYYRYDAFGRRYAKSSTHRRSGRQRHVFHHWWHFGLWSECIRQDDVETQTHYLHHPVFGIAIGRIQGDTLDHYIADDNGQLLALLDREGNARWHVAMSEAFPASYRGSAGLYDSETQLFYKQFSYWYDGALTPVDVGHQRLVAPVIQIQEALAESSPPLPAHSPDL